MSFCLSRRVLLLGLCSICIAISACARILQAPPKQNLSDSELSKQATRIGYRVYDTGDVKALLQLIDTMEELACKRGEAFLCEQLKEFRTSSIPQFKKGRTIPIGRVSFGTAVRERYFGACLIDDGNDLVGANCFYFYPDNESEFRDMKKLVDGAEKGQLDTTLEAYSFLTSYFEKLQLFPVEYHDGGATFSGSGGYDGKRKIPALLRQKANTLYAATIIFIGRPGSIDQYPTLMFSVMRMPE